MESGAGGKRFGVTLAYSLAEAGEDFYEAYEVSLSCALSRKILLKLSAPYRNIDGHRMDQYGMIVRGYAQSGMGDISLFCWYSLFPRGNASNTLAAYTKDENGGEEQKSVRAKDGKKGEGGKKELPCRVMVGAGVKFPTGESEDVVLGEYVPAYYQVGSGTTDFMAGVSIEKTWGRTDFYEQLILHYIPGRNDIEYRRSHRIYFDIGQKFLLDEPTNTKVKIGVSDVYLVGDNWDGLDNMGTIAGPRIGTVKGTKGHYLYGVTGIEFSPFKNFSVDGGLRLPLFSDDQSSEQALDYIVSLGITFRF
ncbi:MAG: hypothetical protein ACYS8W_20540 [Planctomycetota bacterium]|jgi:hypothetical protein